MSLLAVGVLLLFAVFAAWTLVTGLRYDRALRAHGQRSLLGPDENLPGRELVWRWTANPLRFLKVAVFTSTIDVIRHRHLEPDLERRRIDYVVSTLAMVASFIAFWPLR